MLEERNFFVEEFISHIRERTVHFIAEGGHWLKFLIEHDIPEVLYGNNESLIQALSFLVNYASKQSVNTIIEVKLTVNRQAYTNIEVGFAVSFNPTSFEGNPFIDHKDKRLIIEAENIINRLGGMLHSEKYGDNQTYEFHIALTAPNLNITKGSDPLKGLNALIVEDNPVNASVFANFLEEWGIHSEEARNGKEALEKCIAKPFSFILMDIHMPVIDGFEATKRIMKMRKDAIIIALTASGHKDEHSTILALGAKDCLMKPVSSESLKTCIIALLSGHERITTQ